MVSFLSINKIKRENKRYEVLKRQIYNKSELEEIEKIY